MAKSLAKGSTRLIGVLVSDISNPFFSELVKEIESVLHGLEFDLLLGDTGYDLDKSRTLVRRLSAMNVYGVLLLNNEVDTEIAKMLSKKKIPTVLYSWDITYDYVCNLRINFLEGIEAAMKNLYELNHRNIIFVESNRKLKTFIDRKEAFLKSVNKFSSRGFNFEVISGESTIVGGQNTVKKILNRKYSKPTAIMCVNDIQAIGLLFSFNESNINVPKDISLIGLDNIYLSSVVVPKLTTIDLSARRVREKIVSLLFDLIESNDKQGIEKKIETKLVLRNSLMRIN